MKLQLHAACRLFPELPEEELEQLAQDIRANGLRNPIVLLGGKILDGRNRLAACEIAGVKPRFTKWDSQGSPVEWVISQNLIRRHLSASQRAVIAHDLLPMLEQEAKERQRLSKGRGKKVANNCATFSENGKASEAAARITRTNARYVEMVKQIHETAPKLLDRVRAGEVNVIEARRLATVERLTETVAPLLGKHFSIPLKPLMNIPYCQRRARVSSKGLIFYGERQSKKLLRKISTTTGETDLRWAFDEHEARLPFDVGEFRRLLGDWKPQ